MDSADAYQDEPGIVLQNYNDTPLPLLDKFGETGVLDRQSP
jgi:hypothetical protein